jgi:hypothetical protein
MVFFAGLPGTGKSLLIHQLAHLAHGRGRVVHLFQWDVARPAFEGAPAGRRYPLRDGVTHVVIRRAVGLWARRALVTWTARHPGPEHLLVGETPLVGGRLVELVRREADPAEPLLAAESCRFAIPVPSHEVRRHLEAERERRAARPLHEREREDAPPDVLRDLWHALVQVAVALGVAPGGEDAGTRPYDPAVYRGVYERLLRHRRVEVVPLETVLPTGALSVYDFAVACRDLVPSEAETEALIREVERRYPDAAALERELARWWML